MPTVQIIRKVYDLKTRKKIKEELLGTYEADETPMQKYVRTMLPTIEKYLPSANNYTNEE